MPDLRKEWRSFKLDDLFEIMPAQKVKGKAADFPKMPDACHTVPLLTASTRNRGLSRYAKEKDCPTMLENVISVSANGDGVAFYQDSRFAILQDAYAIELKGDSAEARATGNIITGNIPHKAAGLFLSACLNRLLSDFNWSNKSGWNNLRGHSIPLPSDPAGNPDYEYMRAEISNLAGALKEKALSDANAIWETLDHLM